ncbi:MAG TPA: hypothetical protein VFD73_07710 [Gemmatimonadales bacterium]|nr:hypothetical protein [Gemmatimonadales bacterium]
MTVERVNAGEVERIRAPPPQPGRRDTLPGGAARADPQIQVELVQRMPLARDDEVDPCSAPDRDPARLETPHRGLLRRDGLPVNQVLVPEFGIPVQVAGEIEPPPARAITVT